MNKNQKPSEALLDLVTASLNDSKEFISRFSAPPLAIEWITNEVIGRYYLDICGTKTEAAKVLGVSSAYFDKKYLSRNMANMRVEGVTPVIHRAIAPNSDYPLLTIFGGNECKSILN